ncbi:MULTISPECIES: hypothetical protein [unclassified Streptomyces]|uniref:hypothetical protein n=1 Tax=unclassified Streptomyces TaxID=2593676 RepID=UPI003D72210D
MATVVDRRVPLSEAGKEYLRKAFPDHWSFLLGEIALYSLLVLGGDRVRRGIAMPGAPI